MSSIDASSKGIVYVATGEKYILEAETSMRLCKLKNLEYKYCIITDKSQVSKEWDDVIVLDNPKYSFEDKIKMYNCPYQKIIFLDGDTYVTYSLDEVFELLDYFDVVGHQASMGYHYKLDDVPNAFPEFNSGVLGFRKNEKTEKFFKDWMVWYKKLPPIDRAGDQQSLRRCLLHSDVRIGYLTPEFNFMPYFPGYAMTELKIIHGRTFDTLKKMDLKMNSKLGHRVYLPRIGVIYNYDIMSYKEYINLIIRITGVFLIEILRRTKSRLLKK